MSNNRLAAANAKQSMNKIRKIQLGEQMEVINLNKHIEFLENRVDQLEKLQNDFVNMKRDGFGPIMNKMMARFQHKIEDDTNQWMDETEIQFWLIVKIQSPMVYNLLREQFNLYHPDTIDKYKYKFSDDNHLKESIIGEHYVANENFLRRLAKTYGANSHHVVYCGLATDVAAFNPKSKIVGGEYINYIDKEVKFGITIKVEITHIAAYVLTPNDPSLPKTTIFCEYRYSGVANAKTLQTLNNIRADLKRHSMMVFNVASDGDHFF
ncbi:Conserved_hypothetical protein [Hexamita inflata]|uniref:Uncharacterized protein n=1 Tax=Hexamita inflata TaxID=28002 RepID=A0AA86RIW3_9EUKA|nr:Conserved hypothetical protein [Hexamita inflata]